MTSALFRMYRMQFSTLLYFPAVLFFALSNRLILNLEVF